MINIAKICNQFTGHLIETNVNKWLLWFGFTNVSFKCNWFIFRRLKYFSMYMSLSLGTDPVWCNKIFNPSAFDSVVFSIYLDRHIDRYRHPNTCMDLYSHSNRLYKIKYFSCISISNYHVSLIFWRSNLDILREFYVQMLSSR